MSAGQEGRVQALLPMDGCWDKGNAPDYGRHAADGYPCGACELVAGRPALHTEAPATPPAVSP